MILLDTHIWVWWVDQNPNLTAQLHEALQSEGDNLLAVSAISLWEVAKLVEKGRLEFALALSDWFASALEMAGVKLLPLSQSVAVESASLPGEFHKDPADQIIVATARVYDIPVVTFDKKILNYGYVTTFTSSN